MATVEVSRETPTLWPSLARQAHPDLLPPRCGWLCSHPSWFPLQECQPCPSLKKIILMLLIWEWIKTWFCSDFTNCSTSAIRFVSSRCHFFGWLLGDLGRGSCLWLSPSWGKRTVPVLVTIPSLRILLLVKKRCLEAFVSGTITLNMVTIQTSVQTQKRFTSQNSFHPLKITQIEASTPQLRGPVERSSCLEHKRRTQNQTKPKQKQPQRDEGRAEEGRSANTAHGTVSGYRSPARGAGSAHRVTVLVIFGHIFINY